jgi:hypothetical protein
MTLSSSGNKNNSTDNYGSLLEVNSNHTSANNNFDDSNPHISILRSHRGSGDSGSLRSSLVQSFRGVMSSAGSVSSSVRDIIVDGALNHPGKPVSVRTLGGQSTILRSSFTLIKNLVGAGVLALPSGVAAFADSKDAIGTASFWLFVMGIVFGYEFQLIAKVCNMTFSSTFREVWDDTVGLDDSLKHAGLLVSWVNMLKPALGNLAYSMILADTFKSLFATFGWDVARTVSLLLITFTGILPLCLLKNLDALVSYMYMGLVDIKSINQTWYTDHSNLVDITSGSIFYHGNVEYYCYRILYGCPMF